MFRLFLASLVCSSCFVMTLDVQPTQDEPRDAIMVVVNHESGGCFLSKVAVYDLDGNDYQVEGCTNGTLTFPAGVQFGWVEFDFPGVTSFRVYDITR